MSWSGYADIDGSASKIQAHSDAPAYSAVGFSYATEAQQMPKPYAPPISWPAHLTDHLPDSDRIFKVCLDRKRNFILAAQTGQLVHAAVNITALHQARQMLSFRMMQLWFGCCSGDAANSRICEASPPDGVPAACEAGA